MFFMHAVCSKPNYYNKFNQGGYKLFTEAGNHNRLDVNVTINVTFSEAVCSAHLGNQIKKTVDEPTDEPIHELVAPAFASGSTVHGEEGEGIRRRRRIHRPRLARTRDASGIRRPWGRRGKDAPPRRPHPPRPSPRPRPRLGHRT